jgi:hypothetical protein
MDVDTIVVPQRELSVVPEIAVEASAKRVCAQTERAIRKIHCGSNRTII